MGPFSRQPSFAPPEKRDFRQEVTDRIVDMLEKGVAPWQKPWESSAASLGMPVNPTTDKAYRGGNAIHLMAAALRLGFEDPRWMTYKQAADQGWQVRKSETGTQIEYWERTSPSRQSENDPVPEGGSDGQSEGGRGRNGQLIHRVYTVFNAQQVDGIPAYRCKQHTTFEVVHAGEQILTYSGAKIRHDQTDHAFYRRSSDTIHLPPKHAFHDVAGYYGTALHELAHWTGHPERLNRPTLNQAYRFGDTDYAKEELRAELTSVFLAAERGIPHYPERHAAYVGSWIATLKKDKNEIFRAAHDASAASDFLLALERDRSRADQALSDGLVLDAGSTSSRASMATSKKAATRNAAERTKAGDAMDSLNAARAITAQALGDSACLFAALTDSGSYCGLVLGETEHHIVQRQSALSSVLHAKDSLDWRPETGANVMIQYSKEKASVRELGQRSKTKGLSR